MSGTGVRRWLDMKAFAQYIGMNWAKLARFKSVIWTPSLEVIEEIKNGIVAMGKKCRQQLY
ncbi:MAG: hypothetical protein NC453_07925 [Muribaculum sp.]|nr:hypothetical protein [Muribaculum sp.]